MLRLRETPNDVRPLSAAEAARVQAALEAVRVASPAVCARAVAVTRVVCRAPRWTEIRGPRSLVAHVALARRADGIALGHRVFIRRDRLRPDGRVAIDLLAHEVAHVAQQLRDGALAFYARYGAAYAAGRARGLDDRRAYLAIPYEVEARAVGARAAGAAVSVLR